MKEKSEEGRRVYEKRMVYDHPPLFTSFVSLIAEEGVTNGVS